MEQRTVEDGVYEVLVHGKRLEVYCRNMNSSMPQEYLPLRSFSGINNARRNFAEFYSKRLLYPFTCPFNGNRNDSCICAPEGSSKSGITFYKKLRLDLKNMKINIMDSLFSETPFGSLIPYATAGDCYSAVHCPQGRFNIDLTGTGFKIAKGSMWREEGHRTEMDIQFRNQLQRNYEKFYPPKEL
uniref:GON domain-containing protein n=1 Tax=Romanomermis culicivorax TaxID=13658 RepID=A0A915JS95_ROMCU